MHEMSIAQSILEIVEEYLKEYPGKRLKSVTVEVGELTAVVPESLDFCFTAITEETPYAGAKLVIKNIPLTGVCQECNHHFAIKDYNFTCPHCQSTQVKIQGGDELKVSELEVE